jgi:hypothetical protein
MRELLVRARCFLEKWQARDLQATENERVRKPEMQKC